MRFHAHSELLLLVVGGCSGALSQTQHEVRSTRDSGYDSGRQRLCSCWCKHLAPLAMHGANTPKKTDLQMHTYNQMLSPSTKCSLSRLPARARAHTHTVIFSRSCALSCSLSRSLISHLTISIVLSTNFSLQHVS